MMIILIILCHLIEHSFLDDLNDAKNQLADMNRRLHELELELRRLENEREELAAAYKEAEAVSKLICKIILILNQWKVTNAN